MKRCYEAQLLKPCPCGLEECCIVFIVLQIVPRIVRGRTQRRPCPVWKKSASGKGQGRFRFFLLLLLLVTGNPPRRSAAGTLPRGFGHTAPLHETT